ncbi:thiamine pyrophosphate-dependent dehydrogenase E1 component subunit alpha [Pseudonocardia sp.]|uniref:thiamine pyrophosphate-dependent dehydrogenase E1 component subunit alpha n=1 Tax=Pseudonocardia sp. TaxID=60912 RepID=UPI003D0A0D29
MPDDVTSPPPADLYRQLLLCRRFEEVVAEQYREGHVPGPLHLALGQEATAVGVCAALRRTDVVTSTHRGHHHCLAKGADVDRMMAELLGRRTGYSAGRNGSMHIADPDVGLLGTNGIVGGGLPIATGAAFGLQVQGRDDVAVCFFGEGATATGNFGEALNLAALWALPVVFVCENNRFAELTPSSTHVAGEVWQRAAAYGFPGVRVDGSDVHAVAAASRAAVDRARAGDGPTLIEVMTYRLSGHYVGDPATYRDEAEAQAWRDRDAVARARAALAEPDAAAIDAEIEALISGAVDRALAAPAADPEVLG